ncbi:hypothetical protein BC831DRAFT_482851 [Entophlyctis helioformis]|nr:hypothetical protein BC831DRAFT_482851 [Entophlyctis helioformis]
MVHIAGLAAVAALLSAAATAATATSATSATMAVGGDAATATYAHTANDRFLAVHAALQHQTPPHLPAHRLQTLLARPPASQSPAAPAALGPLIDARTQSPLDTGARTGAQAAASVPLEQPHPLARLAKRALSTTSARRSPTPSPSPKTSPKASPSPSPTPSRKATPTPSPPLTPSSTRRATSTAKLTTANLTTAGKATNDDDDNPLSRPSGAPQLSRPRPPLRRPNPSNPSSPAVVNDSAISQSAVFGVPVPLSANSAVFIKTTAVLVSLAAAFIVVFAVFSSNVRRQLDALRRDASTGADASLPTAGSGSSDSGGPGRRPGGAGPAGGAGGAYEGYRMEIITVDPQTQATRPAFLASGGHSQLPALSHAMAPQLPLPSSYADARQEEDLAWCAPHVVYGLRAPIEFGRLARDDPLARVPLAVPPAAAAAAVSAPLPRRVDAIQGHASSARSSQRYSALSTTAFVGGVDTETVLSSHSSSHLSTSAAVGAVGDLPAAGAPTVFAMPYTAMPPPNRALPPLPPPKIALPPLPPLQPLPPLPPFASLFSQQPTPARPSQGMWLNDTSSDDSTETDSLGGTLIRAYSHETVRISSKPPLLPHHRNTTAGSGDSGDGDGDGSGFLQPIGLATTYPLFPNNDLGLGSVVDYWSFAEPSEISSRNSLRRSRNWLRRRHRTQSSFADEVIIDDDTADRRTSSGYRSSGGAVSRRRTRGSDDVSLLLGRSDDRRRARRTRGKSIDSRVVWMAWQAWLTYDDSDDDDESVGSMDDPADRDRDRSPRRRSTRASIASSRSRSRPRHASGGSASTPSPRRRNSSVATSPSHTLKRSSAVSARYEASFGHVQSARRRSTLSRKRGGSFTKSRASLADAVALKSRPASGPAAGP